MSGKRVFVYVQHLLGVGHLKRAVTLARALAERGLEVTLASGGFEVPGLVAQGVRTVQLPPAAALDAQFKVLVDEAGKPIDDVWKSRRRDALLAAWRAADPHALLIELFPFGRRQMRFELLPLLDAARASARRPVVIASSVRDVLGGGQRDPARQDEMLALFERYFDHLLVHGDPAFIAFDRTFRHVARIANRLHYTGYVVERTASTGQENAGAGEVIVSAGGGAVGRRLLEAAVRARPLTALADRTWRVLAGVNAGAAEFAALAALARDIGEGRVIVERVRADFTQLLGNCLLSVSQVGYNTIMEILQAGTRAVAVPWAGGAETEQTLRARLLAERGLVELVEEDALVPQTLAAAVDRAALRPRRVGQAIDLRGAQRSAALLAQWTAELAW